MHYDTYIRQMYLKSISMEFYKLSVVMDMTTLIPYDLVFITGEGRLFEYGSCSKSLYKLCKLSMWMSWSSFIVVSFIFAKIPKVGKNDFYAKIRVIYCVI